MSGWEGAEVRYTSVQLKTFATLLQRTCRTAKGVTNLSNFFCFNKIKTKHSGPGNDPWTKAYKKYRNILKLKLKVEYRYIVVCEISGGRLAYLRGRGWGRDPAAETPPYYLAWDCRPRRPDRVPDTQIASGWWSGNPGSATLRQGTGQPQWQRGEVRVGP